MIFVCGIHGTGKTHYCKALSEKEQISYYSASDLILKREAQNFEAKRVDHIKENQVMLLEELQKIRLCKNDFVLDGHLCLLDSHGNIKKIPAEIVEKMDIKCLIVVIAGVTEIRQRIFERDGIVWDEHFIEAFQNREIAYAREIARKQRIDLRIVKSPGSMSENPFHRTLILPVKPVYADKILSNEKKYEFRKKVCRENIDSIYLYATSPVQGIVGEAEVLEKIIMDKAKLWKLTERQSGISTDYYEQYFQNCEIACAYKVGRVKRYDKTRNLKEMAISYVPQAFAYVRE